MGPTTNDKIAVAVDSALSRRPQTDILKWVSLLITLISITVGTVVWAYNQTAEIRDWTAQQNTAIKIELETTVEKHYVPKSEFTRVEQKLNDQKETMQEIKVKLDRLLEMNNRTPHDR